MTNPEIEYSIFERKAARGLFTSYVVHHFFGESGIELPLSKLSDLYDELKNADEEHCDVSLAHETAWCLSAFKNGLLIWENIEADSEKTCRMPNVSKLKVVELWRKLSEGRVEEINEEPWILG